MAGVPCGSHRLRAPRTRETPWRLHRARVPRPSHRKRAGPELLDALGARGRVFRVGLDFLYLVLYPLWLSLACFLAAMRAESTSRLGAFAATRLGMGVGRHPLDAAENTGLYFWLHGHHQSWLALAISLVAAAKWSLHSAPQGLRCSQ